MMYLSIRLKNLPLNGIFMSYSYPFLFAYKIDLWRQAILIARLTYKLDAHETYLFL